MKTKTTLSQVVSAVLASACLPLGMTAAFAEQASPGSEQRTQEAVPEGLLHIPDFSGDLSSRSYLTGDWGGTRSRLAERGIQIDLESTSWADGFVDGGRRSNTRGGGNLTFDLKWDLMRAGILPGALITLRAESRWGDSGNFSTGQVVPANTAALTPTNYSAPDDGYDLALTQLNYTQFVSPKLGFTIGKLDMFGTGDFNEFAGGRGKTQFMNWSLNYGTSIFIVPASTVGAGLIYIPDENSLFNALLISGTACVDNNCFEDLEDNGGIALASYTRQYRMGELPGGYSATAAYFFDSDFTELDSLSFDLRDSIKGGSIGAGLDTDSRDESWLVGGSVWQYLSVKGAVPDGPMNLTDQVPDLRGYGLFGRLYLADEKTNPWKTSVAFGAGGRGVFDSRPDDLFGVGLYYNDLSDSVFNEPVDDSQGVEAFYNFAITPAVRFSTNLQYIKASSRSIDDTTLLSARLQLKF